MIDAEVLLRLEELEERLSNLERQLGPKREDKRCLHCEAVFEVGGGTGRNSKRKFCSNRCRVAYGRELKRAHLAELAWRSGVGD